METLMSLRTASPAEAERRETRSLGNDSGKGTSVRMAPSVESDLREEVLRLSELVKEKEAMMVGLRASLIAKEEELKPRDAVIEELADTYERDRDLSASETMGIKLESDLRAEVDRLRAKARSEHDRMFAERVASAAQVKELSAKLRSFKASVQSSAIVASAPPLLSLGEEKALIHEVYARHMDRMQWSHDEVVTDLRRRLERYRQRAEERGYAFSDSTRAPSRHAPGPSSFASSARHAGATP